MTRAPTVADAGARGHSEEVVYPGRDLEAMSFALNYHRWVLDTFAPHLGRRVVEVGAGSGSFSELLLERDLEAFAAVEPSRDMFGLLAERLAPYANAEAHHATFRQVADDLRSSLAPDSIVYVNVLEHIADDAGELRAVVRTLSPGGRAFIFVPAFPRLYGALDAAVGHHRRYRRADLEEKCDRAGLHVLASRYFDLPGVLPWWLRYRVLRSAELEPGAVRVYDRYVVPATRAIETRVRPPFGKNLLLVAERTPGRRSLY